MTPTTQPSAAPSLGASPLPGSHLAAVLAAGVLRVNVAPDDGPWSRVDADGDAAGFQVGLARQIARQLGVDLVVTTFPATQLLDGSTVGQWDLALTHLPAGGAGAGAFLQTQPYAWDPLGIAVTADRGPVPDDLTGLVVCVTDGSAAEEWIDGSLILTGVDGELVGPPAVATLPVTSTQGCREALASAEADAWVDSLATLSGTDDGSLLIAPAGAVAPIAGVVEPAGSTDLTLVDAVNAAIDVLRDEGQLLRLSRRAFGADLTQEPEGISIPAGSPSASPSVVLHRTGRS
jgi:ABC-type amino acid transport substrate-binding protein